MAKMLGRSRSLRMLKGSFKQTHKQDNDRSMPSTPLPADAQIAFERLNAAIPASQPDERLDASDIPQRPRTSGGPGDRGKQFHKKTTPTAQPDSEHLPPPAFSNPSPTKSATVLYAAEVTQDREGIIDIGIALGSPGMPGMPSNWDNVPRMTDSIASMPRTVTHISSGNASYHTLPQAVEPQQEAPKPKLSRWKSLFKKTAPPPRQEKANFYQLAQSVTPTRADSHHEGEFVHPRTASLKDEDAMRSVSPPAFKPEIRESRKAPKGTVEPPTEPKAKRLTVGVNPINPKAPLLRSASSPKPPAKDIRNGSSSIPKIVYPNGPHRAQDEWPRPPPEKPLLDVNIPDVKMERYSVMFSGLLQQNPNGSLLARRQGNSERVKPLHDLSIERESRGGRAGPMPQRRATSPIPAKSPSGNLSLFPPANTPKVPSPRSLSVNRPRPVQRSRTEPTKSPLDQDFPRSAELDVPRAKGALMTGLDSPSVGLQESPTSDRSFDSDSESITIVVARSAPGHNKPWKNRFDEREPEWEIVNKPSAAAPTPAPSSTQLSSPSSDPSPALMPAPLAPKHQNKPQIHVVTKQSALSSHPSSAPLDGPSASRPKAQLSPPMSADRAVEIQKSGSRAGNGPSQATVGVARSVSVSRANKPELLRSATLTRRGIDTSPTERLVENKALTPTLVEIGNRKSQRVQLVDA